MVYVFLANGFEEIEALATVDMLRRAEIEVVTAGVGGKCIIGTHNIEVKADICACETELSDKLEGIVLPGGMPGTVNLEENEFVQRAIDFAAEKGLLIGAICAAPSVLGHKGLLKNKKATAFPGFEKELSGALVSEDFVVRDGNIITSKGAGATINFALEIVGYFKGEETKRKLRDAMQCVR